MDTLQDIFNRVEGERNWQPDIMPLEGHDNLLKGLLFDKQGYTVVPFLPEKQYQKFISETKRYFLKVFAEDGLVGTDASIKLHDYHKIVQKKHINVLNKLKHINSCNFPIPLSVLEGRISEILGFKVTNFNPITQESVFHYRIVRPLQPDYNPMHRDTWHSEYENCINIYVPVCGSNEKSSLPIVEGSHYWNDNLLERTPKGAMFNHLQFTVPAITNSRRTLKLIRPNPQKNEVMVFSPYLIHGAAANWNLDQTRISLEMRFWRE